MCSFVESIESIHLFMYRIVERSGTQGKISNFVHRSPWSQRSARGHPVCVEKTVYVCVFHFDAERMGGILLPKEAVRGMQGMGGKRWAQGKGSEVDLKVWSRGHSIVMAGMDRGGL